MKREESGFFDIFYGTRYFISNTTRTTSTTRTTTTTNNSSKTYFYSHQFDGIKAVKYDIVKEDILQYQDYVSSPKFNFMISELEKGKRQGKIKTGLIIGGLATFIVGAATFPREEPTLPANTSPKAGSYIVSGIGFLTVLSSLALKSPKARYLNVIRTFNQSADY